VLLWMPTEGRIPGGHIVQLERTAAALADAGLEVETDFTEEPTAVGIDLVHGFALETRHIRYWHRRGIPVALSSIYWERAYRVQGGGRSLTARSMAGRGLRAARFARAAFGGRNSLIEACMAMDKRETTLHTIFESVDVLLPNAEGEGESIRRDLGVTTPIHPVPNGVDPSVFTPSSTPFEARHYVLYVGRIEPHKNQLGLIEALRHASLPLVIAGNDHPDHSGYAQACRQAGSGWVRFVGPVAHGSAELSDLYAGARVHVVPSWFETTGLVSLEAALSGCSIVSTSRGHAREYLDRFATYCDPGEPGSILAAVRHGWETPPSPELCRRILDRYTWSHVAKATVAAYATLPERSARP
jgi:glycosyltransferase involved in cell wall biosynthesis